MGKADPQAAFDRRLTADERATIAARRRALRKGGVQVTEGLATAGERCMVARKRKGLTQAAAAQRMGVTRQTVVRWEQNRGDLRAYAENLGVDLLWWERLVCPHCGGRVFETPPEVV